jgi:hypothetical protein
MGCGLCPEMNGKQSKKMRRIAGIIAQGNGASVETTYVQKVHTKFYTVLNEKGEQEKKSYKVVQVVLGKCVRSIYQRMKQF